MVSQFATGQVSQGTSGEAPFLGGFSILNYRERTLVAACMPPLSSRTCWGRAAQTLSGARAQDPTKPSDRTACSQGAVPGKRWWWHRTMKNRAAGREAWLRLQCCTSCCRFSVSFHFLKNGAADNDHLTGQPVGMRHVSCPAHNRHSI